MSELRTIIVTGASSGIGAYCARALKRDGWRVFATARKAGDIEALAADGIEAFYLDYREPASIEALVTAVLERTGGTLDALDKLIKKLQLPGVELRFVYEAGPCGYVICRHLKKKGLHCEVVAPSLIPRKASDRVKTDRRDAQQLARLYRAGELTAIYVPDEEDEAVRDLVRARNAAVIDQRKARQRLKGFLLRLGFRYTGKSSWNDAHKRYLSGLVLDPARGRRHHDAEPSACAAQESHPRSIRREDGVKVG